jgi:hypothetical protein
VNERHEDDHHDFEHGISIATLAAPRPGAGTEESDASAISAGGRLL